MDAPAELPSQPLRKRLRVLLNLATILLHILPVILESFFLKDNIKYLVGQYSWYVLANTSRNRLSVPIVILTRPEVRPLFNNTITLDIGNTNCAILRYASNTTEQYHNWDLRSSDNVAPPYHQRYLVVIFACLRWLTLIIRAILIVSGKIKCTEPGDFGLYLFFYVSCCVLSICVIGSHICDCIDWWALGGDGLRLFQWQVAYWILNGCVGFVFVVAFLIAYYCPLRLFLPSIFRCEPTPFRFLTLIIFGATAFLSSVLVIALGMFKSWIFSIIAGMTFLFLEWLMRRKYYAPFPSRRALNRPYAHCNMNANCCTKIPDMVEDDETMVQFRRVPHTHLFVTAGEAPTAEDSVKRVKPMKPFDIEDASLDSQPFGEPQPTMLGRSSSLGNSHSFAIARVLTNSSIFGENGSGICLVCIEEPSNVILQPCRHGVVCRPCMKRLVDRERQKAAGSGAVLCPLCRSHVDEMYEIVENQRGDSTGIEVFDTKRIWVSNTPSEECAEDGQMEIGRHHFDVAGAHPSESR